MLQRQLSKEGLQNVIEDKAQVNHFATDDLKKLFLFRPKTASDLHDELQCTACRGRALLRPRALDGRGGLRGHCRSGSLEREHGAGQSMQLSLIHI